MHNSLILEKTSGLFEESINRLVLTFSLKHFQGAQCLTSIVLSMKGKTDIYSRQYLTPIPLAKINKLIL